MTEFFREMIADGNGYAVEMLCELGFNPFKSADKGPAPIYKLVECRDNIYHRGIFDVIFKGMRKFYMNKLSAVEDTDCPQNVFNYSHEIVRPPATCRAMRYPLCDCCEFAQVLGSYAACTVATDPWFCNM